MPPLSDGFLVCGLYIEFFLALYPWLVKFILLEYHEDGWCIEGYLLGKLAYVKMFLFCLCTWFILWLGIEFCAKIFTSWMLIHFPRIFQCQWLILRILISFWFQIIFKEFMFVPLYLEAFRILFIILRFLKSHGDVLWQRSIFFLNHYAE